MLKGLVTTIHGNVRVGDWVHYTGLPSEILEVTNAENGKVNLQSIWGPVLNVPARHIRPVRVPVADWPQP